MKKFNSMVRSSSKSGTPTPQPASAQTERQTGTKNPFGDESSSENLPSRQFTDLSVSASPAPPAFSSTAPLSNQSSHSTVNVINEKGGSSVATVGSGDENDLLVQRLQAWKHLVKALSAYLSNLADHYSNMAKSLIKVNQSLVTNQVDAQYFLPSHAGGVFDFTEGISAQSKTLSERYAILAKFFSEDIIPNLQSLRKEIKNTVSQYQKNAKDAYSSVNKYQKLIDEEVSKLSKAIDNIFRGQLKNDPWLSKQAIEKNIQKRSGADKAFYETIQSEISKLRSFDISLAERFSKLVYEYTNKIALSILPNDNNSVVFLTQIQNLQPNVEWDAFANKFGSLISQPMGITAEASSVDLNYPHKDNKMIQIVKSGPLERQKGIIKTFTLSNIVITEAGFLHSFPKSDTHMQGDPDTSIYLVRATVEPGSNNTFVVKVPSGYPGKGTNTFRATSQTATTGWINAIQSKIETQHIDQTS
ncbi:hypothetical protein BB560_003282 [Smittium megazygosporum]|uniref:PH domain-containing protein n=1 Tax=Smittium megazygosporum TaxID=133381 RepID=A0A2T9ZCE3_9FUNG|nr:hypothetical protein BB560_003282 [Smittium megazygosporum]